MTRMTNQITINIPYLPLDHDAALNAIEALLQLMIDDKRHEASLTDRDADRYSTLLDDIDELERWLLSMNPHYAVALALPAPVVKS